MNRRMFISVYFSLLDVRTPSGRQQLLPFFHAFVSEHFDIDAAVELAPFGVSVAGQRMRSAVADGNKNAPHWEVLDLIEITRYSGGTLLAQLLIRFAAQ